MRFLIWFLGFVGFAFVFALPAFAQEKEIRIEIAKQKLYAIEDDKVIFETPVSTGLVQSPTVRGNFQIYKKLETRNMRGVSPVKGRYYLPKVPHVMYFYQSYAIHGAYWHNNFGRRMSNGCVNLPLGAAAWLYDWASYQTSVKII